MKLLEVQGEERVVLDCVPNNVRLRVRAPLTSPMSIVGTAPAVHSIERSLIGVQVLHDTLTEVSESADLELFGVPPCLHTPLLKQSEGDVKGLRSGGRSAVLVDQTDGMTERASLPLHPVATTR